MFYTISLLHLVSTALHRNMPISPHHVSFSFISSWIGLGSLPVCPPVTGEYSALFSALFFQKQAIHHSLLFWALANRKETLDFIILGKVTIFKSC